MGLRQAIDRLPRDRDTERAVRDTLELFRSHEGRPLSPSHVSRYVERPEPLVTAILLALTDCYVLRCDDGAYVYRRDKVSELEIDLFMRHAENQSAFVQSNLAKFRERYGRT